MLHNKFYLKKFTLLVISTAMSLCLTNCTSTCNELSKSTISTRQDSLFRVLEDIRLKQDFIATSMGYRSPADTFPVNIPLSKSPMMGNKNALVTIVEFSDLECPFCANMVPIIDSVAKKYPRDVKVVFKHFPLPTLLTKIQELF